MEELIPMLDATFWTTAAAIVVLLVLSAFFSGSETALTASSRGKLKAQAEKGSRGAERALLITEDNERLIGSVLLGNNIVNILSAALATSLFTRLFGESGVALATLMMTALVLIFAEVLPKTYAITNAERAAAMVSGPIKVIVTVFAPVVTAVRWFVRLVLAVFGVNVDPEGNILAVRDEIAGALSLGQSEGLVEKEDRDRILGALDLAERTVEEIMRHRSEIRMLNADTPPETLLAEILQSPHTRLPIWKDDPDNIVGVAHAKDVLRGMHKLMFGAAPASNGISDFNILDVAMKPYFIPETTTLDDQMRAFLERKSHFALVVDEYGALQGLITLEDILEEINIELEAIIQEKLDNGQA